MLDIQKTMEGDTLTIKLSGRLDTSTAPSLDEAINESIHDINALNFDIEDVAYISSVGLRIFLSTQKKLMGKGGMKVLHPTEGVKEIFSVTGFDSFLTIEE